jgi:hypothetical protein
MFSKYMNVKSCFVIIAVLTLTSLAIANPFSDNFESYNPPLHGNTPLTGKGGWVTGEANGTTISAGVKIYDDWGVGNSDAVFIEDTGYEHIAHSIGSLEVGDQVTTIFQIPYGTSGYAEVWVGDARHVDGTPNNEISLWVKMQISTGNFISYNLCSDSPETTSFNGIQRNDDRAGYGGHVNEVRLTMITSGGPAFGIDSAVIEARNVTTGSDWQYIGVLPINTQSIGWDNIYIVLGGRNTIFDNLSVSHSPTAVCNFIHLWGGEIGSDIIPDCRIDMRDLARLAADWTQCNDPTDPINCDLSELTSQNGFSDEFSTYTLDNTGLPGGPPDGSGGDNWEDFFGGSYEQLEGNGGWVQADFPGDAGEIIMIDNWGANPDPAKSGVYPHSGWVSPYFIGGGLYTHNGIAHSIGSLSAGDQISWIQNISHASCFMVMSIGTDLANGNAGDDVKFSIEMGGAVGGRLYYRIWDSSGSEVDIVNDTTPAPPHNAGHMGNWQEVVVTMGAGLSSIDIDSRNLTRYDDGSGGSIVGIGPWVNIGGTDFSIGSIASSDPWIAFDGIGGSNNNWSRAATFDVVNIVTPSPTNCNQVHQQGYEIDSDIVPDCIIDLLDLEKLVADFLSCNDPRDMDCEITYSLPQLPVIASFTPFGPDYGYAFAAWGDYNNDGWVDLYAYGKMWRNDSGTSLTDTGTLPGTPEPVEGIFADFNNDGYLDVGISSQKRFYRNLGQPAYNFLATPSFPTVPYANSHHCTWADYNKDGYVDMYAGGYMAGWWAPAYPDALIMNNSGTSFYKAWETTFSVPARGVTSCDFDEDGDMDIYVSNYAQIANLLWQNNGTGSFTDVAGTYNVAGDPTPDPPANYAYGHSIGSVWGDLDSDGDFDLFVGNLNHHDSRRSDDSKFYRNNGPGGSWHFTDVSNTAGLVWQESYASPALADYDNDGFLDMYLTALYSGDNSVLYHNNGDWSFTDVTASAGLSGVGVTSAAAWGDFNNDGNLDLATGNRVYINSGSNMHWLKVRLRNTSPAIPINRLAIGAQARIILDDGRVVTRQVESGTGEGNQNELTLHFGLGDQMTPVDVEVFWPLGPNGTTTYYDNADVDTTIEIDYADYAP